MKLNHLMLAAAALCGATQVMAQVQLTGASASSVNVARAAKRLCTAAQGTFTLYKTSSGGSALGNVWTGKCSTSFDGTEDSEVRVNVSGGSANAVLNAANGVGTPVGFLANTSGCVSTAVATNGALSWLTADAPTSVLQVCSNSLTDGTSNGGFLDVEGVWFSGIPAAYRTAEFYAPAGFSQAFGVAVNSTLYLALQADQKTAAGAARAGTGIVIPASCASGDTTEACQPSISKAVITALINSNVSPSGPKNTAATLLTGAAPAAANAVTYCMRPQTSGTQQSAQLYFLNYEATNPELPGKVNVVAEGAGISGRYSASVQSGSTQVKDCLGNATGYRFGILSGENNPVAAAENYRFVKLNRVAVTEGTTSATNTFTATTGAYDFVYETVAFCNENGNPGECHPFVSAVTTALPAGASTPGLFLTGVESRFGRGGNSAVPYGFR